MRMRITMKDTGDRVNDMRVASDLSRYLWTHAPVEIDLDNPLEGINRNKEGRTYFEFFTRNPDEVRRALREHGGADVELTETNEPLGEACQNCGNIAGPLALTVCPNCGFRDISPCPVCAQEIPRQQYAALGGNRFRCPHCRHKVHFRFNSPMFLADGDFNQPLIVVDEVAAHHEVR